MEDPSDRLVQGALKACRDDEEAHSLHQAFKNLLQPDRGLPEGLVPEHVLGLLHRGPILLRDVVRPHIFGAVQAVDSGVAAALAWQRATCQATKFVWSG